MSVRVAMLRQMVRVSVSDPRPPADDPQTEALRFAIERTEAPKGRYVWHDGFVAGHLQPFHSTAGHVEGRAFQDWASHLDDCDVCATGAECPGGTGWRRRWHLAYAILREEDRQRGVGYR